MDPKVFSEWLSSLPLQERIHALARIYSALTICTRELFRCGLRGSKEQALLIRMLDGINELHHTLANWLVVYTSDESKAFPVGSLAKQLLQIGQHYHVEHYLTSAVENARTGYFPARA